MLIFYHLEWEIYLQSDNYKINKKCVALQYSLEMAELLCSNNKGRLLSFDVRRTHPILLLW